MLELYPRSARGIARTRSSLVGPPLDGFAATLREQSLPLAWARAAIDHLGLPTTLPEPLPARTPPEPHVSLSQEAFT